MEFTQMNKVNVTSWINYNFNQSGADTIHAVTLMRYHTYPSQLILKHVNDLAEEVKSYDVYVYKNMPYKKFTVLKYMYAQ